jgi:hypothetical protein
MPMTSRERIAAAFAHREPDRTPIFEYVLLSPVADAILARPFAGDPGNFPVMADELGWERAVRREASDRLDLAERLGHDLIYCVPNAPQQGGGEAPRLQGEANIDDPVERVRLRNKREGAAPAILPDDRFLVHRFIRDEMERRGIDLPLLVPTYDHGIWTDTDLMQTMLLDPDVAREHFALCTARSIAHFEKYLAACGADLVGVGGDFAGTRPLISAEAYREFIMPDVAALSRRVHGAGRLAVNASDGHLWPVIEDFLFGCEVDGYIEIDLHAGMDLRRLKALYGERTTFLGNLDCGNLLSFGTPDDVRRHVVGCLDAGSGNGGHILCASNAITPSVPVRNYLALVNSYREYFALPPLKF